MNPDAAINYLDFITARHSIWAARQEGLPGPWTEDPVLASRKFTNVFRVLDPGTQFVLTDILDDSPDLHTALARVYIYRWTNHLPAWKRVHEELGHRVGLEDIDGGERSRLADLLVSFEDRKIQVFSPAYMTNPMPNGQKGNKSRGAVQLAFKAVHPNSPDNIWDSFRAAQGTRERVDSLVQTQRVGTFMALQIITDLAYHYGWDQNDYVASGPGSRLGAAYLVLGEDIGMRKGMQPDVGPMREQERLFQEAVEWCRATVESTPGTPRLQLEDGSLMPPSLMDLQNTLCEFSKYVRYQQKGKHPEPYRPTHPGQQPTPVFPTPVTSPE